jgi:hypothetical protein
MRLILNASVAALTLAMLALQVGAASADFEEPTNIPSRVDDAAWSLHSIDGARTITYTVNTYRACGLPHLVRPKVIWRPGRVILTARVFHPAIHLPPEGICAATGFGISGQFKFTHSIRNRIMFDGSTKPPKRRFLLPYPGPGSS